MSLAADLLKANEQRGPHWRWINDVAHRRQFYVWSMPSPIHRHKEGLDLFTFGMTIRWDERSGNVDGGSELVLLGEVHQRGVLGTHAFTTEHVRPELFAAWLKRPTNGDYFSAKGYPLVWFGGYHREEKMDATYRFPEDARQPLLIWLDMMMSQ